MSSEQVGREAFNRVVQRYLEEHAYGNVIGPDFFSAFDTNKGVVSWNRIWFAVGAFIVNINSQDVTQEVGGQVLTVAADICFIPVFNMAQGIVLSRATVPEGDVEVAVWPKGD